MDCAYFGVCGSCREFGSYEEQLLKKVAKFKELFGIEPEVFASKPQHFRARAEFRYIDGSYGMHSVDGGVVKIKECPIVLEPIFTLMPKLREYLASSKTLSYKLFRLDFLSSTLGEVLVSLVYHKPIDEVWEEEARKLAKDLGVSIVGRSRGKKIVIGKEYVEEEIAGIRYYHYEGSFTQPNPFVNAKMIEWAKGAKIEGDLLELYCGSGNFTLPLAKSCRKVLATEVSKTAIKAAKRNASLNNIQNVTFVRLSAQEVSEALAKKREFRRLKEIDLDSYDFKAVFVDPPRCGLDEATRELVAQFDKIIYISCNPLTLHRDIQQLQKTHTIQKAALFDQFPYTSHIESGVVLVRR